MQKIWLWLVKRTKVQSARDPLHRLVLQTNRDLRRWRRDNVPGGVSQWLFAPLFGSVEYGKRIREWRKIRGKALHFVDLAGIFVTDNPDTITAIHDFREMLLCTAQGDQS